MMKIKIPGILVALLLLTSLAALPALAAGSAGGPSNPGSVEAGGDKTKDDFSHNGLKRYDIFFDRLVAEGAIDAEQEAAIKSAIENAVKDARQQGVWRIDMSAILSALVREGRMSAEQQAAVENALKAERLSFMTRRLRTALDRLVSDGTITEAVAQKIMAAATEAAKSGIQPDMRTLLENLTKSGVIDEKQFAAIKKALMPPHHGKPRMKTIGLNFENPV
jgi:hypothetical protein